MKNKLALLLCAALLFGVFAVACDSGTVGETLETEPESEIGTESETEAGTETDVETEPETKLETEPETEPETEAETESETNPETELETEPETEPETEAETESETNPETELETEPETEAETEGQEIDTTFSWTIGDVPVENYTIVYARSKYSDMFARAGSNEENMRSFYPVYDFDKESAERLVQLIYGCTGIELPIVEDKATEETQYEILVGKTNRSQTRELGLAALDADNYVIGVSNGKLALCGGDHGTTWHAIDHIEEELKKAVADNKSEYAMASDLLYNGTHHLVRIGCIGDSITEGAGATSSQLTYVSHLDRLLWKDAVVKGYGCSSTCMRTDLSIPYMESNPYQKALKNAADTDIFTIMLGTNDSNRDTGEWSYEDDRLYVDCCKQLLQSVVDINSKLEFVIANAPYNCEASRTFGSEHVRNLAESMIPELRDSGYTVTFVDMYTPTAGHDDWFGDTLHPSDVGYLEFALIWADYLQDVIDEYNAK